MEKHKTVDNSLYAPDNKEAKPLAELKNYLNGFKFMKEVNDFDFFTTTLDYKETLLALSKIIRHIDNYMEKVI